MCASERGFCDDVTIVSIRTQEQGGYMFEVMSGPAREKVLFKNM